MDPFTGGLFQEDWTRTSDRSEGIRTRDESGNPRKAYLYPAVTLTAMGKPLFKAPDGVILK